MMLAAPRRIGEALRERGVAHVSGPLDLAGYLALASSLGEVVSEERIALRSGAHAYVAKSGRVPLHTDHPEVGVIGWLCERQDAEDGASLLLDTRPIVTALSEREREVLRLVELECPPLSGGPPTERWPVLRPSGGLDAVFCSPWLRSARAFDGHQEALDQFRQLISAHAKAGIGKGAMIDLRLAKGEALFVDNRRILHGRRAIAEASPRQLLRLWIRLADARVSPT